MNNQIYKQTIFLAKPKKSINKAYSKYDANAYRDFYDNALPIFKDFCGVDNVKEVDVYDIWLRDFFPLQNPLTKEVFRYYYNPLYGDEEDKAVYDECRKYIDKNFSTAKRLPVWMDGGNLIYNDKFGICLDTNGTDLAAKTDIIEAALGITVIVLPYRLSVPDEDATGHIDGSMQFLGENVLFISEPFDPCDAEEMAERKMWIDIINEVAGDSLRIEYLPNAWGECSRNSNDDSAKGIYVNFLETENAIFVPQYNLPADEEAKATVRKHTNKKVVGIDCDKISKHGGSLHCLTADLF